MYSDKKFRHNQYYVCTEWPGGHYGSPTVSGSRSGGKYIYNLFFVNYYFVHFISYQNILGIIAACWATLMYFGMDGYINSTRAIMETKIFIQEQ